MKLRALCVCSSMVVGWCCRFLGIMEAEIENENVLQYYTIIRGSDVLNEENDSQQNIIIYTVDAKNDTEDSYQEMLPEAEGTFEDCNQSVEIPNMKLVTLEDGSMFVTTGNYEFNENGSTDETKQVTYTEDIADENGEYREITLEDGSVTLVHVSVLNSLMQHADYQESPKSEKRYACPFKNCEKVYTSSHHLTVHIRNHTGARPYQCEVEGCEKAFATGYSLKAHLRTHTGEKPYGCLECNKHFKTSGDLHKHIRTHTGEKPFKCPIDGCGRSFTTSNIRKVHIRSHTGERPYSCSSPGCGKAFASATNFRNHVRIHTGEKPYVCPIETCGKRFTEYSSLYKHNAMHQSSKRVKCGICGHKYAHEATLDGHRKAAHPEFEEHELKILEDSGEIKFEFQEVRNTVGEYLDEKINGEIIDEFS